MNPSLTLLCSALKKIIVRLKPNLTPLSFLLLIGQDKQGKTTLLRQSGLEHVCIESDNIAHIFYNQHGIIVELTESWLNQSNHILSHTLKQLNRCHPRLRISGLLLCIDINTLLVSEPLAFAEQSKAVSQRLARFSHGLGYPIDLALFFTKVDAIAGFSDFFQYEHAADLGMPLGFSLPSSSNKIQLIATYQTQFDEFIEVLGQQVIQKIHPARSTIKRTLIREFPLQLATLRQMIQVLIQLIPSHHIHLQAIYFTSAEQGGISLDRLSKKIQHECALTVHDKFPQAINYRPYFITGAIDAFQLQTKRYIPRRAVSHKWAMSTMSLLVAVSVIGLAYQHVHRTQLLNNANHELQLYESARQETPDSTSALYHLNNASKALDHIHANRFSLPTLGHLKNQLHANEEERIQADFIPGILHELEQVMGDPHQSQAERYHALKCYLSLASPAHFSEERVIAWFETHAPKDTPTAVLSKKISLLKAAFQSPRQPITINQQQVSDVRNYLNALPASYFYYSLLKADFPPTKQPFHVEGFVLASHAIPSYFTKAGFQQIMARLPDITQQLQTENWVLARQDINDLHRLLQHAYCADYVLWWQHFMQQSKPLHAQNFQQAHQLLQILNQSHAFNSLLTTIQQQTSPESGEHAALFNQEIASKFTALNLISHSTAHHVLENISELEQFVKTLSIVNDKGATAFGLIKARYQDAVISDPLSTLFQQTKHLPAPLNTWGQAIANDTWLILMNDARTFLNHAWQRHVYHTYQSVIAGRYPFDASQGRDVTIADFDHFFANNGALDRFVAQYLKPFIDTSKPQWQLKELNGYVLPISEAMINELIRANIISNMFFTEQGDKSHIEFTLQKLSLDPVVASLQLSIGETKLHDDQASNALTRFYWPQANAKLTLDSIEGNRYALEEEGPWAFFRMLQKVNVLVDEHDSATLQILFEVNGNSGRYVLKAQNQINPFIPGILNGFTLSETIV